MPAIHVGTLTGTSTALDVSLIEALRTDMQGELLLPSDANYDAVRRIRLP